MIINNQTKVIIINFFLTVTINHFPKINNEIKKKILFGCLVVFTYFLKCDYFFMLLFTLYLLIDQKELRLIKSSCHCHLYESNI